MGGMETRGIGKSKGTLTMKTIGLWIVKSCKAEGKLLVTYRAVQIIWSKHKKVCIHTSENILLNSSDSLGHKQKETLVATMSS